MGGISAPYISRAHTHSIPAATTTPDGITATGTVQNVTAIDATLNGSCGSISCDSSHPVGASNRANLIQAAAAVKTAVVTAIPAATGPMV